jgi:hypothetical protein
MPPVDDDARLDVPVEALSRRGFLELIGAGAMLAGAACAERPARRIYAYHATPPEVVPGVAW